MKILCITDVYQLLSGYIFAKEAPQGQPGFYKFLQESQNRKHEVHIIFRTGKPVVHKLSDNLYSYPGNFSQNTLDHLPFQFLFEVLSAVLLGLRLNRKMKFDVIYGQQSYGAAAGYILSRLFRVPNATRLYGSALYAQYGANKWRIILNNLKSALPFIFPSRYLIITQDGTQANKIAEAFGVDGDRLRIWFNGIDKDAVIDQKADGVLWPVPAGTKSILWLGRLQGWKHPERALEAFDQLRKIRDDVHLVFIGSGSSVPALTTKVDQLQLNDCVHFLGSVSHKSVSAYCKKADIFLSLLDFSNLSNTVIEAMSSGCCVVALDNGDTDLLIKDGETGILVNPDSLSTLPNLLNKLLNDQEYRTSIGKRAQNFIYEHLPSWEERINQEVDLLENLARENWHD